MYCEHCGTKIEGSAQFCQNCGKTTSGATKTATSKVPVSDQTETKVETIVKCGNCDYVGHGEPARSPGAVFLAWVCIIIAWPITILYFATTHKYRCPKCKSTFLGIKNKEGVFTAPTGGNKSPVMIFIWILLGIAIVGILSSVVLASLNTAREKGRQAQEQSSGQYK